ncbi:hypothetical protein PB2503_04777 [Parvularcula bermudensis HTCC2503]|uniref:ATPase, AFG1 family protein n=1 Tax=Parvularcula bermudensis (strain ATCC BAA-594 / HTCC2503 / KCTC 12087) TaxID=314260 RepID=E0TFB2_PARBH|nr:cell division protein ZapE [Parvularcula bermudensis]ADM09030.1 hypothetical protein PB2503_04777 [Parvularcula bermudensis HTCC2503]
MTTPLDAYRARIDSGQLAHDPAQEAAASALNALARRLERYNPYGRRRLLKRRPATAPTGLYLWGGVGAGKSLLMDLFFENVATEGKIRRHFQELMQDTHKFIAEWRGLNDKQRRAHPARKPKAPLDDPIPHAAHRLFSEAFLICLDEVQVTDITDAMLIGRLFTYLYEAGGVTVMTSNRHPTDLYKDGLNRDLFLPAIDTFQSYMEVLQVDAERDYRLGRLAGAGVYFTPLGPAATKAMDEAFAEVTGGAPANRRTMQSGQRVLTIPMAGNGVARGSFDHWCSDQFGPKDYLELAASFTVFFIDDIPVLSPEDRNEAKRFTTLIDALYEAKVKLICSAAAEPDALYPTGHGAFEFERTASRLHEMRSTDYIAAD